MSRTMTNRFERDHFYTTAGRAIESARDEQNLSRGQLADRSKLTTHTIESAEKEETCSLLVIVKIATGLDVNVNDLIPLDALP